MKTPHRPALPIQCTSCACLCMLATALQWADVAPTSCSKTACCQAQPSKLGESMRCRGQLVCLEPCNSHQPMVCVPQVVCQLAPMLSKHLLSVTPVVAQVGTKIYCWRRRCLSNPQGRSSKSAWICCKFLQQKCCRLQCSLLYSHESPAAHTASCVMTLS